MCVHKKGKKPEEQKEIWTGLRASFQEHNLPAQHSEPMLDLVPNYHSKQAMGRAKMLKKIVSSISSSCWAQGQQG